LIDPHPSNLMSGPQDLFLDCARTFRRLVLDDDNFRHPKTIRNPSLFRNSLSSLS
jgi:hypothetical protein